MIGLDLINVLAILLPPPPSPSPSPSPTLIYILHRRKGKARPVLSCVVLSYHVLLCFILSCLVLSCLGVSSLAVSCLSCLVLSCALSLLSKTKTSFSSYFGKVFSSHSRTLCTEGGKAFSSLSLSKSKYELSQLVLVQSPRSKFRNLLETNLSARLL